MDIIAEKQVQKGFKGKFLRIRIFIMKVRRLLQKIIYGYSNDEIYNLYEATTEWMLPRLEKMHKIIKTDEVISLPHELNREEWVRILGKIIWAIKAEADPNYGRKFKARDLEMSSGKDGIIKFAHKYGMKNYDKEEKEVGERIKEGFRLLGKYFTDLWI